MKRLIYIVGTMLLASCYSTSEKDVKDAPLGGLHIEVRSPKENWTWQELVNKTNPDFPDFPDPRYLEYFLKYDEYGGVTDSEMDTLNIVLRSEKDFSRLPQRICGIPTRYYSSREFPGEYLELFYEIRIDANYNTTLFIGLYTVNYLDSNDVDCSHTFASQAYIDSVLQAHNRK